MSPPCGLPNINRRLSLLCDLQKINRRLSLHCGLPNINRRFILNTVIILASKFQLKAHKKRSNEFVAPFSNTILIILAYRCFRCFQRFPKIPNCRFFLLPRRRSSERRRKRNRLSFRWFRSFRFLPSLLR